MSVFSYIRRLNYVYDVGNIDYFSGPFFLKFPAGVTNVTFHVLIADDKLVENSEYIYFCILHESLHYPLKRFRYSDVHIYIQDNDCKLIFNKVQMKLSIAIYVSNYDPI